jgi:hypothetical protein
MTQHLTAIEFEKALMKVKKPGGEQPKFLRAHAQAKGRALTMRRLSEKAGYRTWRGMNLQYGLLAKKIGKLPELGVPTSLSWLNSLLQKAARRITCPTPNGFS